MYQDIWPVVRTAEALNKISRLLWLVSSVIDALPMYR
jgi:hypothetical protein